MEPHSCNPTLRAEIDDLSRRACDATTREVMAAKLFREGDNNASMNTKPLVREWLSSKPNRVVPDYQGSNVPQAPKGNRVSEAIRFQERPFMAPTAIGRRHIFARQKWKRAVTRMSRPASGA